MVAKPLGISKRVQPDIVRPRSGISNPVRTFLSSKDEPK
jgi:hypothetical protein